MRENKHEKTPQADVHGQAAVPLDNTVAHHVPRTNTSLKKRAQHKNTCGGTTTQLRWTTQMRVPDPRLSAVPNVGYNSTFQTANARQAPLGIVPFTGRA